LYPVGDVVEQQVSSLAAVPTERGKLKSNTP
jgi:hypothetical protein